VFFVYTGLEAVAGAWAYSLLTEARGLAMMTAGTGVSLYWGGLTAGRIGAAFLGVGAARLLRGCMLGQAVGALLLWVNVSPLSSLLGLVLLGLTCAPVFPTLIAATPARLGAAHTANGIGFQIAAAVLGQSLLPAGVGVLARSYSLEILAPALLVAAILLALLHEALLSVSAHRLRIQPTHT
jgi:fucose permease